MYKQKPGSYYCKIFTMTDMIMQNSLVYKRTVESSLFLADGVSAKGFLNNFLEREWEAERAWAGGRSRRSGRSRLPGDAGPSPRTLGCWPELKVLLNGATQVPLMFCVLILVSPWLFKGITGSSLSEKLLESINPKGGPYEGLPSRVDTGAFELV